MHMASVSGYDQDIFISYAHVDDEPFDAAGPDKSLGWVAALVRHLENCLAREIGRKEDFTLWKDKYNLHGNDALTTEIATKLRQTGVFVPILSPGLSCLDVVPGRGTSLYAAFR